MVTQNALLELPRKQPVIRRIFDVDIRVRCTRQQGCRFAVGQGVELGVAAVMKDEVGDIIVLM